ncbi:hypothetical protein LINPERHAP1_LOCUS25036 [Linum perenne]
MNPAKTKTTFQKREDDVLTKSFAISGEPSFKKRREKNDDDGTNRMRKRNREDLGKINRQACIHPHTCWS